MALLKGACSEGQVVSELLRNFSVVIEFHRMSGSAAGSRSKVGHVSEHRGHRDKTGDGLYTTAHSYSSHFSASGMQIAEDISHRFFGSYDLERHDRLEYRWGGLVRGRDEGLRARHLEGVIV